MVCAWCSEARRLLGPWQPWLRTRIELPANTMKNKTITVTARRTFRNHSRVGKCHPVAPSLAFILVLK